MYSDVRRIGVPSVVGAAKRLLRPVKYPSCPTLSMAARAFPYALAMYVVPFLPTMLLQL